MKIKILATIVLCTVSQLILSKQGFGDQVKQALIGATYYCSNNSNLHGTTIPNGYHDRTDEVSPQNIRAGQVFMAKNAVAAKKLCSGNIYKVRVTKAGNGRVHMSLDTK